MSYKLKQKNPSDPVFIYKDDNQIAVMMPEDFEHMENAAYFANQAYKAMFKYGESTGHYGAYKCQEMADLTRKMVLISAELNALNQILEDMRS